MIMGQGLAKLNPLCIAYNHSYANRNSTCIHNTNDKLDVIADKITNAATDEEKKAAIVEYQQKMYDECSYRSYCTGI